MTITRSPTTCTTTPNTATDNDPANDRTPDPVAVISVMLDKTAQTAQELAAYLDQLRTHAGNLESHHAGSDGSCQSPTAESDSSQWNALARRYALDLRAASAVADRLHAPLAAAAGHVDRLRRLTPSRPPAVVPPRGSGGGTHEPTR